MITSVGVDKGNQPSRQLLIEQAERVIAKAGISAVHLREVADQVDVPFAEAREHFASDGQLVEATTEDLNAALTSAVDLHLADLPEDATAIDRLRAASLAYFLSLIHI